MSSKSNQIEINKLEGETLRDKYTTALRKGQFINELKNGLGKEILKNPGKPKIIKKSFSEKVFLMLKKIFTSF